MSDTTTTTTTADTARVERDLDETRSRLGAHVSQLEERLSPGQVLDDLMTYFRGSEGAVFGRTLVERMQDNPIPAAVTGIGLAWLMASNPPPGLRGERSRVRVYRAGEPVSVESLHHYGREDHEGMMARLREAEQRVTRTSGETESAFSSRMDEARGRALGLARHTQESAESFSSRIRDALASAQRAATDRAKNLADRATGAAADTAKGMKDRVGGAAGSMGGSARDALSGAADYAGRAVPQGAHAGSEWLSTLTDSPILLGAIGLAAGAVLGALIPQSEMEEEALGGIAGQARRTASDLASEGRERGQHVAQAVMDKAKESAREQGLSTDQSVGETVDSVLHGDLAGRAKNVAQDVLRTGKEAVSNEASQSVKGKEDAQSSSRQGSD